MTRSAWAEAGQAELAEGYWCKTMCDVQNLQVTTGVQFDPRAKAETIVTYSYFIQGHGPFEDKFTEGTDTPEIVKAAQQARYDKLVAVGAISPNGY